MRSEVRAPPLFRLIAFRGLRRPASAPTVPPAAHHARCSGVPGDQGAAAQRATRRGTVDACERSLRRLGTDRVDLYLLHWRSGARLHETLAAFAQLVDSGKIRYWEVSNFDRSGLVDLPGGDAAATDQVLYNLTRRGVEHDLLPWCRAHHLPVIGYSPIEQGRMLGDPHLSRVAERHGVTPGPGGAGLAAAARGAVRHSPGRHTSSQRSRAQARRQQTGQAKCDVRTPQPPPEVPQEATAPARR